MDGSLMRKYTAARLDEVGLLAEWYYTNVCMYQCEISLRWINEYIDIYWLAHWTRASS